MSMYLLNADGRLRRVFRVLSTIVILSVLLVAGGADRIMAQQISSAEQKKAVYEQMNAAYGRYVDLLKQGRENSPEGTQAFNDYAVLKSEYDRLSGGQKAASGGEAEGASASAYDKVASSIVDGSGKLFEKALDKVKSDVIPGGKKMSLLEKIAWGLGKSIIPTAAVLAFAALAPLPLGFMIAGSILVGALSSGVVTYFFERRSNAFRDKKKNNLEILRDVSVAAVADGIMAPFTMATAGLASTFGKASVKVIVQNAIRGAGIQFVGQAISSGAAGAVKHQWAKNVFHYDQKIAALQDEANKIFLAHSGQGAAPLTEAEKARLTQIAQEIDEMKAQDYNVDDFRKDLQRAALSSAISGVVGTSVSAVAANSKAANLASIKLFGNTSRAGAIANWVTSNPVAFLQGTARAQLEKHYISDEAKQMAEVRDRFARGSVPYNYYNSEVARLTAKHDSIKPLEAGLQSAVVNFAVQSVSLGVQLGKEKLVDSPRRDKAAIQERFMERSKEWQQAADQRKKINEFVETKQPDPHNYNDVAKYLKDKAAFNRNLEKMEREAAKLEVRALDSQRMPDNQKLLGEVKAQYQREQQLEKNLEYARFLGQDQYLNAFKEKMKLQDPKMAALSDADLTAAAKSEISRQNVIAFEKSSRELAEIEARMEAGKFVKNPDGKSSNVPEALREFAEGKRELTYSEKRAIEFQAARISPSVYKAKIVNSRFDEMRAKGATDAEIVKASEAIYADAERRMLDNYGGKWSTVMYNEFVSRQLRNLKYDEQGKMSLWEQLRDLVSKDAPQMAEKGFVDHYRTEVNTAIKDQLLPGQFTSAQSDAFNPAELFIDTSVSALFDKVVIEEGSNRLFNSAVGGVKSTIGKPVQTIEKNTVTPYELNVIMQNRSNNGRIGN